MSDDKPRPAGNSDACKASCGFALGVAEQFLTLAAGGIAFVVGLVFSHSERLHPALVLAVMVLLAASICLGMLVRMGMVSNIRKQDNYDVYGGPVQRVAAAQIVTFLIATGLLGGWTLHRAFSNVCPAKPAIPTLPREGWLPAGAGITRGVSGLEVLSPPGAEAAFLVVHDNKASADGLDPEPRFALLTRRGGTMDYQAIPWPGAEQPNDLEALAAIPGRPRHFAALTSKGRLYTVALDAGGTALRITHEAELPNPAKKQEFESFEIALLGKHALAVWIDRGTTEQPAQMLWAPIDLEKMTVDPASVQSTDLRVPWPADAARPVSDAKIDGTGTLFISATSDPGDEGPFASAVYAAGSFEAVGEGIVFHANPRLTRLYVTERHKIEALALWPGAGGALVLGSDDENAGGAVHIGW